MADKVAKRGVSIYIDGQEVTNSVKSIRSEMSKLSNEQAKMTIGSDEYVAHAKKIAQLKQVFKDHVSQQQEIAKQYETLGEKLTRYSQNVNKYFGIIALGAGALGAIGAAFFSTMGKVMEFSKAVSQLSALTGATGNDLDYLKDKAKDLGSEYGKSATEIVTAMKLVGSAKPELLSNVQALSSVTESVLTLSSATGMDLTETTKNLTTIMNQFGLSAVEADRTINVLAAGSKFGAVEVDYLGESISKVGTVAKSSGLSLEQTTAMMELFGEKGVKAETAGTGFKSVLVKLQADTENYTNGVFDLNKAITNNQGISTDNIALQEKFGKEFFNLAQILFQNADRFKELTKQVTGTKTAEEQMSIATDNLSGDMDKMEGAWSKFILSLEDGQGPIANAFRSVIQGAKDALDALSRLTKSDAQNERSDIEKQANMYLKVTKDLVSGKKDKIKFINGEIVAEQKEYQQKEANIKQMREEVKAMPQQGWGWRKNIEAKYAKIKAIEKEVMVSKTYINMLAALRKEMGIVPEATKPNKDGKSPTVTDDKTTPYERAIKLEEQKNKELIALHKEAYATGMSDEEDYYSWMAFEQMKFLNLKLALQKQYGLETVETEIAISDLIIAEHARLESLDKTKTKKVKKEKVQPVEEHLKAINAIRNEFGLTYAGLGYAAELDLLKEKLAKEKATEEETAQAIADFKRRVAEETAKDIYNMANEAGNLSKSIQEAETLAIDNKYAKQLKAAKKAGQDTTVLEAQIEEEKVAVKKQYADIDFAITAAKITASTAEAVIKMWAQGGIAGPALAILAGAAGVAELAVANEQRAAIQNLWTGGFTPNVGKYEPTGVVHGGEFVASQEAVRNSQLRPILNAIDAAQRNGTVSSLSRDQLTKALGGGSVSTTASPARQTVTSTASDPANNDYMAAVLERNAQAMERLNKHIDNGINANVSIHGKNGISENTILYDKLKANATR